MAEEAVLCICCGASYVRLSELRSDGKLKHAPPMPRSRLEMAKLQGRLKAGCSQDWLPHNLCRTARMDRPEAYPTG